MVLWSKIHYPVQRLSCNRNLWVIQRGMERSKRSLRVCLTISRTRNSLKLTMKGAWCLWEEATSLADSNSTLRMFSITTNQLQMVSKEVLMCQCLETVQIHFLGLQIQSKLQYSKLIPPSSPFQNSKRNPKKRKRKKILVKKTRPWKKISRRK